MEYLCTSSFLFNVFFYYFANLFSLSLLYLKNHEMSSVLFYIFNLSLFLTKNTELDQFLKISLFILNENKKYFNSCWTIIFERYQVNSLKKQKK